MLLKCHSQYNRKFENSAVATGLGKVTFHSNSKERQSQIMLQVQHICIHFPCQQNNAQNSSSQASTTCEPRNSRCSSWIQKSHRNQRTNCQHLLYHIESKRIPENTSASLTMLKPSIVCITTKYGKFFKQSEYQITLLASSETCIQVKKQQLEPDM